MTRSSLIIFILTFTLYCSAVSTYYSQYNEYLRFHWSSAVKSTSILFKVFPYLDKIGTLNTFIVVYTKPANVPVTVTSSSPITFTSEDYPVQEATISGLTPNTQYYYTFIFTQDATIDPAPFISFYSSNTIEEFKFRTSSVALTSHNFTFGAASCAETGSTSSVFKNLLDENLDFFFHMGDLHYSDIAVNETNRFYDAYYRVFGSPTQKKFFQNTPLYYVWDDHDFGPNDARGTSASKPAATAAFKRFAPYTPLKNTLPDDETGVSPNMAAYLSYTDDPNYGIFRSFIIGRCLFIMMDLRTYKDVIPGDLMGDNQKTWIENQIRYAGLNPDIKLVFFISSVPWISVDGGAEWADFEITQEWIGTLVKQHIYNNNKEAMLIAGDAHMVAFDDGRNNKWGGFPVVQAAALDRTPSCKGGPYSHGFNMERGQYGRIEVTDSINGKPCVNILLKKLGETKIAYNTCHPQLYPPSTEIECPWKIKVVANMVTEAVVTAINNSSGFEGAPYAEGFGGLGVLCIIGFAIFMCRRRSLRRKAAALKEKKVEEYAQGEQGGKEMKDIDQQKEEGCPPSLPLRDNNPQE